MAPGIGAPKKKPRVGSSGRLSYVPASDPDLPRSDVTPTEFSKSPGFLCSTAGGFNDSLTADVLLRLYLEPSPSDPISSADAESLNVYLHSRVLCRSNYFSTLLSDRWRRDSSEEGGILYLSLAIPFSSGSMDPHLTVLQLLYSSDFSGKITSVAAALAILPVALELLFNECVEACASFLEAVPWSEDEEKAVISLIPLLDREKSQELLARVLPPHSNSSEEMLDRLVMASIGNQPGVSSGKVKTFVAKMLRDFPSRDSVRRVFDHAFDTSLRAVKEYLESYSSPDLRGDHDETEAMQRLNLHKAVYHGKDLLWVLDRMFELKIADTAVKVWSEQTSFVADLRRVFQDDSWKLIAPALPNLVLRCTGRLVEAVATGSILAARQVRLKLISVWLPLLIVCKENRVPPIACDQDYFLELEDMFLRIISTLPMSEAEGLLRQCLSFASRNVEDCPHLVSAFNTWFRRANCPPHENSDS